MDFLIEYTEINGNKYKLQHPGNREVLKLRTRCTNPRTGVAELEPLLDYCFEHVVIADGHAFQPTIDTLHPKEFEEWLQILPRFLRHGSLGESKPAGAGTKEGKAAS